MEFKNINISDEKIVTVDESGTIHVVTEKPGVCTVTAKVKGLKAVRCKIRIKCGYLKKENMQESKYHYYLKCIDETGMIHAKKKGKVTIVVYCASYELVTVKKKKNQGKYWIIKV